MLQDHGEETEVAAGDSGDGGDGLGVGKVVGVDLLNSFSMPGMPMRISAMLSRS